MKNHFEQMDEKTKIRVISLNEAFKNIRTRYADPECKDAQKDRLRVLELNRRQKIIDRRQGVDPTPFCTL